MTEQLPASPDPVRRHYLGRWRVDVTLRPGVDRLLPSAELARRVVRALEAAGAPSPASIGLVLSNDAELAVLNESFMGKSGPTDVLSFPLMPPEAFPPHAGQEGTGPAPGSGGSSASRPPRPRFVLPPGARLHLGDIVVSVERAVEQAEGGRGGWTSDVRWSPAEELRLLVTHGTLHVCGWDHAEPPEETAMRALERRLLEERR